MKINDNHLMGFRSPAEDIFTDEALGCFDGTCGSVASFDCFNSKTRDYLFQNVVEKDMDDVWLQQE